MTNSVQLLPPPDLAPRKHLWTLIPVARLDGHEFPDGNDRTFRTCSQCQMIKVTVHTPDGKRAWREWRTKDGKIWQGDATPPCVEISEGA